MIIAAPKPCKETCGISRNGCFCFVNYLQQGSNILQKSEKNVNSLPVDGRMQSLTFLVDYDIFFRSLSLC